MSNGDNKPDFIPAPDFIPVAKEQQQPSDPSLWDKLNTGLVSPETLLAGDPSYRSTQEWTKKQIAAGHPIRAGLGTFATGTEKSIADIASSLTSPVSLGLAALTGGESLAGKAGMTGLQSLLRVPQFAAALGFGTQGAVEAMTPRKEGEDTASMLERRLFGASAAVGGAAGAAAATRDALHKSFRKKLGMSDDLASKVSANVNKIQSIKQQSAADLTRLKAEGEQTQRTIASKRAQAEVGVELALEYDLAAMRAHTSARISGVTQQAEQEAAQLEAQGKHLEAKKIRKGSELLADTAQALHQEGIKARQPFIDVGNKITEPFTDVTSVKGIIENSFKRAGVNEEEIPKAVFKALGPEAGPSQVSWFGKTMDVEKIIKQTKPENVARMREAGILPEEGGKVTFNDLTRVREDLWQQMKASKDSRVTQALEDAHQKVTALQDAAAEHKGLGTEWKGAKQGFMKFKRELGSPMVESLLEAGDAQEQGIASKLAQFTNKSTASPLHDVLKAAGIDTAPFMDILDQIEGTEKKLSEVPKRTTLEAKEGAAGRIGESKLKSQAGKELTAVRKTATEEARTAKAETTAKQQVVESEAKKRISAAEAKGEIVPGKTSTELAGLTNQQLLGDRLRAQADAMRKAGIAHPGALMQTVIGLVQLAKGSTFGFFHFGRAFSTSEVPEIVKSRKFQKWVLNRSGIEDPALSRKISRGLEDMYPYLRRMVKSGIQEQATANSVATK